MTVRRRDLKKLASVMKDLLLKINNDVLASELRDSLNFSLHRIQRYHRLLTRQYKEMVAPPPNLFVWPWQTISQNRLPNFLEAIQKGDEAAVEKMLQNDPKLVNCSDTVGQCALMYALKFTNIEIFNLLLMRGALVNQTNQEGQTSASLACYLGLGDCLGKLISQDADLDLGDQLGRSPLHWSTIPTDIKCLQMLLKRGAKKDVTDIEGQTVEMWACIHDRINHVQMLRSDVNYLHGARRQKSEDDGSDELRDKNFRTWIHHCVYKNNSLLCLKKYMSHDVMTIVDAEGRSVFHVACELGNMEAVNLLVEKFGQDLIEERDYKDRTPIIIATIYAQSEILNYLLTKGADMAKVDNNGATAWDYARSNQFHFCMFILVSHMRQRTGENHNFLQSTSFIVQNLDGTLEGKGLTPRPPSLDLNRTPRSLSRGRNSSNLATNNVQTNGSNKIAVSSKLSFQLSKDSNVKSSLDSEISFDENDNSPEVLKNESQKSLLQEGKQHIYNSDSQSDEGRKSRVGRPMAKLIDLDTNELTPRSQVRNQSWNNWKKEKNLIEPKSSHKNQPTINTSIGSPPIKMNNILHKSKEINNSHNSVEQEVSPRAHSLESLKYEETAKKNFKFRRRSEKTKISNHNRVSTPSGSNRQYIDRSESSDDSDERMDFGAHRQTRLANHQPQKVKTKLPTNFSIPSSNKDKNVLSPTINTHFTELKVPQPNPRKNMRNENSKPPIGGSSAFILPSNLRKL